MPGSGRAFTETTIMTEPKDNPTGTGDPIPTAADVQADLARIREIEDRLVAALTREPSTPSAQAVGHVCRDVSQARMVANLPEGTALYATPSAQADDLKWLGSTTAGIRLASMLRDEVKAGDFRQALAEVIALVRQSTPSAQVSGGGEHVEVLRDVIDYAERCKVPEPSWIPRLQAAIAALSTPPGPACADDAGLPRMQAAARR